MPTDCISYQNSGYFDALIKDYLDQKPNLQSLYNRFPILKNFEEQILEKKENFDTKNRTTLVSVLEKQYSNTSKSDLIKQNIKALSDANTFTITTGHQLNLFTGPLYFLYKIISTINLSEELKIKYPKYNFVPIYWMATEDHDFEEINYFNFKGRKFRWDRKSSGPVGRLSTQGLASFFEVYNQELGSSKNAETIKSLFENAYLNHENLAEATQYLANELFGQYGLVVINADNQELKRNFTPYIKEELLLQTSHKKVLETTKELKNYSVQVNPREINLFYLEDNLRERIILEKNKYKINNTAIEFSEAEILDLLKNSPEKFSPNVIMRPLYQEVILPNLCYIGGGGEIAYWLELKSYFETANVTFPMLLLRNSALLTTEKQNKKATNLNLCWADLFLKQNDLINKKVKLLDDNPVDLSIQKDHLKSQFHYLHTLAQQTEKSFIGAVKAQERKQIKGLENLERRLLKAQKRKHTEELERIITLQNELFPNQSLQERQANFSEFYLESGEELIQTLMKQLKPLNFIFEVISL